LQDENRAPRIGDAARRRKPEPPRRSHDPGLLQGSSVRSIDGPNVSDFAQSEPKHQACQRKPDGLRENP